MTIGENIKRLRKQRGLTQAELAFLVGINEVMIRRYEIGDRKPKLDKLEKIASALGVNVAVLTEPLDVPGAEMQSLFRLFRDYGGYFDDDGNLKFKYLNINQLYDRWKIYQHESEAAEEIEDEEIQTYAIEDAEDKFNYWMDIYPRSIDMNRDFDTDFKEYREIKNRRRPKDSDDN